MALCIQVGEQRDLDVVSPVLYIQRYYIFLGLGGVILEGGEQSDKRNSDK